MRTNPVEKLDYIYKVTKVNSKAKMKSEIQLSYSHRVSVEVILKSVTTDVVLSLLKMTM